MRLSRRKLLGGSLAAAGLSAGHSALAGLAALTPPQTLGPFYPVTKPLDHDADLTTVKGATGPALGDVAQAAGEIIDVAGRVLDRNGRAVPSALVEIWQCNAYGRYDHPRGGNQARHDPNFQGFGQDVTDPAGGYRFRTIKPPPYPASASWMRPSHIHFRIVAPAAASLVTQMYFAGDPYLAGDFIFNGISDPMERAGVVASLTPNPDGTSPPLAAFDIILA